MTKNAKRLEAQDGKKDGSGRDTTENREQRTTDERNMTRIGRTGKQKFQTQLIGRRVKKK